MGSKYVKKKYHENQKNDELCSVCQEGGYLLLCDRCPSSYHLECAQIEVRTFFFNLMFIVVSILHHIYLLFFI